MYVRIVSTMRRSEMPSQNDFVVLSPDNNQYPFVVQRTVRLRSQVVKALTKAQQLLEERYADQQLKIVVRRGYFQDHGKEE